MCVNNNAAIFQEQTIPANSLQGQMLREIEKNGGERAISETLKASDSWLNVKVHDSAVRQTQNKCASFGMAALSLLHDSIGKP